MIYTENLLNRVNVMYYWGGGGGANTIKASSFCFLFFLKGCFHPAVSKQFENPAQWWFLNI